jgi:hypothetical protein
VSTKTQPTRGQLAKEKRKEAQREAERLREEKRISRRTIKHAKDARIDVQVIKDEEPVISRHAQAQITKEENRELDRIKKHNESLKKLEKRKKKGLQTLGDDDIYRENAKIDLKPRKFMIDESLDPLWTNEEDEIKIQVEVTKMEPVSKNGPLLTTMKEFTLSSEVIESRRIAGIEKKKRDTREEKQEKVLAERRASERKTFRDLRTARREKLVRFEDSTFNIHGGVEERNVKSSEIKKKVRARKHNEHPGDMFPQRPFTKNQVHDFRQEAKEKREAKIKAKHDRNVLKVTPEGKECMLSILIQLMLKCSTKEKVLTLVRLMKHLFCQKLKNRWN